MLQPFIWSSVALLFAVLYGFLAMTAVYHIYYTSYVYSAAAVAFTNQPLMTKFM